MSPGAAGPLVSIIVPVLDEAAARFEVVVAAVA